jgi:sulfur carrier protein ThiS
VRVTLRNPKREVEVQGPISVRSMLEGLGFNRESVLVIVDGALVTADRVVAEGSEVEIRPVISGGAW